MSARSEKKPHSAMKETHGIYDVPEYWLAGPNYRTVDQFVLENGKYALRQIIPTR